MKFLFCEGKNDVLVIQGLSNHLGLNVAIEPYGGKNNLSNFLESLPKRPEFAQQQVTAIAILRDADADSTAAFASVRDTLQQYNFAAPDINGTFTDTALRAGIFIVGLKGQGMIEDICLDSVSDQPEFSCVDAYFTCIARKSARSVFSSKAKVRVWMASQVDYEYYIGKAAEEGYWPWESPAFNSLKNFLKAL